MRIEHIAFNVPDAKQVAQWYADNLGVTVKEMSEHPVKPQFIVDEGGNMIEFYTIPAAPLPDYHSIHTRTLHIAFEVDDVAAVQEKLVSAGAVAQEDISVDPAGNTMGMLRDPWGIPLQLVQRVKPI